MKETKGKAVTAGFADFSATFPNPGVRSVVKKPFNCCRKDTRLVREEYGADGRRGVGEVTYDAWGEALPPPIL